MKYTYLLLLMLTLSGLGCSDSTLPPVRVSGVYTLEKGCQLKSEKYISHGSRIEAEVYSNQNIVEDINKRQGKSGHHAGIIVSTNPANVSIICSFYLVNGARGESAAMGIRSTAAFNLYQLSLDTTKNEKIKITYFGDKTKTPLVPPTIKIPFALVMLGGDSFSRDFKSYQATSGWVEIYLERGRVNRILFDLGFTEAEGGW